MQKIKQYLSRESSVRGATLILVVTLLASNILGLIRDHFIAQKIPTSLLDTYYAAFRIPDLIFNILILGAIAAAFIPVFTNLTNKKNAREAWHVVNSFLNISILVLIVFAIILAIVMPYLVPLMVPDFTPDKQLLTTRLARIMLVSPIFFGISYIFGGMLNSMKRFLAYSISPLVYNLCIIIATIFLSDKYGVYGIVIGVVSGAFLHMAIQIPVAYKLGYRYRLTFDWKDPNVKKIFYLMVPRSIGLGANQVMLLVYTSIASTLAAGSVAIYNLADNIQTMPVVVFGTSFATAIFPSLSESISVGDKEKFVNYIWRGMRAILFLLIPAGIGIILLRAQVVRLILGSGFFGWTQTVNTANTLGYLAVSMFTQGISALIARSFYALHNTKIPMISSISAIIISVFLGYILAPKMGVAGLGLAFSIGSIANALVLYLILRTKIVQIKTQEAKTVVYIGKIFAASLVMIAVVQLVKNISGQIVNMDRFWGVFVQTALTIIFGGGAYLAIAHLFHLEEIKEIIHLLKKKFGIVENTQE